MTSIMKPAKRILCVLLAFLMVFTACFMPMAKAAVVETIIAKYGVEILATILIGSGIGFASSDNARSAAAGCYEWISTNAPAAFQELTKWAGVITGNPATLLSTGVGVKFSESFWDAIEGAVSSFRLSDGSFALVDNVSIDTLLGLDDFIGTITPSSAVYKSMSVDGQVYYIEKDSNSNMYRLKSGVNVTEGGIDLRPYTITSDVGIYGLAKHFNASDQTYLVYMVIGAWTTDGLRKSQIGIISGASDVISLGDVIPSSGDLVNPSDHALVKMPDIPDVQLDADGKETIVYPDMALDQAAHLADIPKADVATGELVDVPTDSLVDVTTGELVQTGEGTGEGTDTGLWDWLKSLLKSILDAIKSILAAIVGFFDTPADFRLDFDGFKNMRLPTRFPFCIPFDFVNAIRVFTRNAQDFQFRIDLETSYFQIHHVVDLTPFILPIAFFRYTACVWFGLVLINKTRDLIKW